VAVPGPDPANSIFKQYYPHGIPKNYDIYYFPAFSINFVIFIQVGIPETEPGVN
jgi:hypothetical protein